MKLSVKEITNMRSGVNSFANVIYNNFIHLSNDPQLQHNTTELRRLLNSSNMVAYVVYQQNTIIAYLVGETKHLNDGRDAFYISYLYIGQKYRGKKLGSKLMKMLINKCNSDGTLYILLTCDIKDKKVYEFYEKIGFMPDAILRNYGRHEVLSLSL